MTDDHQTAAEPETRRLTEAEVKARTRRTAGLAAALVGFVVLVGATTMVRLAQSGLGPGQEFYWHIDN